MVSSPTISGNNIYRHCTPLNRAVPAPRSLFQQPDAIACDAQYIKSIAGLRLFFNFVSGGRNFLRMKLSDKKLQHDLYKEQINWYSGLRIIKKIFF
jgi:hypothetical protein